MKLKINKIALTFLNFKRHFMIHSAVRTSFDRLGTTQKADCCEKSSNAFLYFLRNTIGQQRFAIINNSAPTRLNLAVKKIVRVVSAVFAFLLALPLTLIGLMLLRCSKTHRQSYADAKKALQIPATTQQKTANVSAIGTGQPNTTNFFPSSPSNLFSPTNLASPASNLFSPTNSASSNLFSPISSSQTSSTGTPAAPLAIVVTGPTGSKQKSGLITNTTTTKKTALSKLATLRATLKSTAPQLKAPPSSSSKLSVQTSQLFSPAPSPSPTHAHNTALAALPEEPLSPAPAGVIVAPKPISVLKRHVTAAELAAAANAPVELSESDLLINGLNKHELTNLISNPKITKIILALDGIQPMQKKLIFAEVLDFFAQNPNRSCDLFFAPTKEELPFHTILDMIPGHGGALYRLLKNNPEDIFKLVISLAKTPDPQYLQVFEGFESDKSTGQRVKIDVTLLAQLKKLNKSANATSQIKALVALYLANGYLSSAYSNHPELAELRTYLLKDLEQGKYNSLPVVLYNLGEKTILTHSTIIEMVKNPLNSQTSVAAFQRLISKLKLESNSDKALLVHIFKSIPDTEYELYLNALSTEQFEAFLKKDFELADSQRQAEMKTKEFCSALLEFLIPDPTKTQNYNVKDVIAKMDILTVFTGVDDAFAVGNQFEPKLLTNIANLNMQVLVNSSVDTSFTAVLNCLLIDSASIKTTNAFDPLQNVMEFAGSLVLPSDDSKLDAILKGIYQVHVADKTKAKDRIVGTNKALTAFSVSMRAFLKPYLETNDPASIKKAFEHFFSITKEMDQTIYLETIKLLLPEIKSLNALKAVIDALNSWDAKSSSITKSVGKLFHKTIDKSVTKQAIIDGPLGFKIDKTELDKLLAKVKS